MFNLVEIPEVSTSGVPKVGIYEVWEGPLYGWEETKLFPMFNNEKGFQGMGNKTLIR